MGPCHERSPVARWAGNVSMAASPPPRRGRRRAPRDAPTTTVPAHARRCSAKNGSNLPFAQLGTHRHHSPMADGNGDRSPGRRSSSHSRMAPPALALSSLEVTVFDPDLPGGTGYSSSGRSAAELSLHRAAQRAARRQVLACVRSRQLAADLAALSVPKALTRWASRVCTRRPLLKQADPLIAFVRSCRLSGGDH